MWLIGARKSTARWLPLSGDEVVPTGTIRLLAVIGTPAGTAVVPGAVADGATAVRGTTASFIVVLAQVEVRLVDAYAAVPPPIMPPNRPAPKPMSRLQKAAQ